MTTRTDPTVPLAAAVKGARSLGLPSANVSVHALEAAIAEAGELRKRVEQLTDRVIGASDNRADAEDLRRENAELHKMLADGATSETMIAKLREWTAQGRHEFEPGASFIAMPVSSVCKIVDEIDDLNARLTAAERRPNRAMYADGPEITVTGTPLGPDRPVRHTLRQVGWLGQTGAFYDLDENPRPTERGSYAPLYFIAHSDEYDPADSAPQPTVEPVHFTTTGTIAICGRRAGTGPKGQPFTLAFDPDDDAIDCRECGLYLKGLRAAPTGAGSPR